MSIGDRIKELRGKQSQSSFAELLGIAQRTLANYERNERTPNTDFAILLAQKFNVSFDWLLTGANQKTMPPAQEHSEEQAQTAANCPKCAELEARLDRERDEVREMAKELREINAENRTILKENGKLKEEIGLLKGELKARAAPTNRATTDSTTDAASVRKTA